MTAAHLYRKLMGITAKEKISESCNTKASLQTSIQELCGRSILNMKEGHGTVPQMDGENGSGKETNP